MPSRALELQQPNEAKFGMWTPSLAATDGSQQTTMIVCSCLLLESSRRAFGSVQPAAAPWRVIPAPTGLRAGAQVDNALGVMLGPFPEIRAI
jgi:hypothetical protein